MAVHSTHDDNKTEACLLRIVNKSSQRIKAVWVGFDAAEASYMEIEPGHARPQQTFTTHVWRIRFVDTNALLGEYSGPSAMLEAQPDGTLKVHSWSGAAPKPKPEWGEYFKRGDALGIEIWSYNCVDRRAIRIAQHIVSRMLEWSPAEVVHRMVAGKAVVAVIGRGQLTTDIPAHMFMRWAEGGRDTDSTTRGLGGTAESPTTSCGEENLLMEDDRFYPCENILVHEFGHAVMNIGLTAQDRADIKALYQKAYQSGLYDTDAYIMENEDEYWAEGTQAWFDATIRMDVTSGINTREKLWARDPELAKMMIRAYGDGSWRYPHDSPAALSMLSSSESGALAEASASASPALGARAGPGRSGGGAAADVAITLAAPDVEGTMERARLAASLYGNGAGWLSACAGGSVAACAGPVSSPGCGTALWAAVREAVLGHPGHSTVKLS